MIVGDAVAAYLEKAGVSAAFGVISIHNMPILDALHRRGRVRFVPARSESGAVNMADAHARVSGGLGIAITSTGTAAGNASGAMVEALSAGTPLLHLTGQIDSPYLDRDLGYLHEARDQLGMLTAVSKAAFRIDSPDNALHVLRKAAQIARTPPSGPVSIEIPIDVQQASFGFGTDFESPRIEKPALDKKALGLLAEKLSDARRPLLWLGGGARHAGTAVAKLVDLGFGVVTSVQGRGIVPEDHPASLGAFNVSAAVEAFYARCDALVVAGSRLRSNETLGYELKLPGALYRIDAEPKRAKHPYAAEVFVRGDCADALAELATKIRPKVDPDFTKELKAARQAAEAQARSALGPYESLVDELQHLAGRDFVWVRDVTISNSTWGNRLLRIFGPRDGVHALGGGIGQGLPMAIGAAVATSKKVICLAGDGGLALNLGELGTLAQEKSNVMMVLMNDRGYGVIRNIQDAQYGGRRCYADLATPDFELLARAYGVAFFRIGERRAFRSGLEAAMDVSGPAIVEIDMNAIGPFAGTFAGPPVRKRAALAK
jgi:acetolactate synthase-1/2/3 large subunit